MVLASAIWMGVDASALGYDKRDIRGLAAIGPAGWFFCGLFFWIVAFPLYLIKRESLKAAGERRRAMLQAGMPPHMPLPAPGQSHAPLPSTMGQGHAPWPGMPPQPLPPTMGHGYGHDHGDGHGHGHGHDHGYDPHRSVQAPSPLTTEQVAEQIAKLGELRVAGLITEAEFTQQKERVLARLQ